MSNLTGLQNGVFNTLHLVDETGDQQEVRDIFLTGSIEQSIPTVPTSSQVLSIPGLVTELQNNPGPKGEKGSKGSKGNVGNKGETGLGSKGSKGD